MIHPAYRTLLHPFALPPLAREQAPGEQPISVSSTRVGGRKGRPPLKEGQSLLGRVLKEYRWEQGLTQEQLAITLCVEPRTLRAWENEHPTNNIQELRRIAGLLGIAPERLGVVAVDKLGLL